MVVSQLTDGKNEGAFGHPVVILSTFFDKTGQKCVRFMVCTSMGGQGMPADKPLHHRLDFLLIQHEGTSPHDNTEALELEAWSEPFKRPTFVWAQKGRTYSIETKNLLPWIGGKSQPITLSPKALQVIEHMTR